MSQAVGFLHFPLIDFSKDLRRMKEVVMLVVFFGIIYDDL